MLGNNPPPWGPPPRLVLAFLLVAAVTDTPGGRVQAQRSDLPAGPNLERRVAQVVSESDGASQGRMSQAPPQQPSGPPLTPANGPQATSDSPVELLPHPPADAHEESRRYEVPLAGPREKIRLRSDGGLVSLVVRNGPLQDVLTALAETQGLNVVTSGNLDTTLTITLDQVELEDALDAICAVTGYTWTLNQNIVHVTSLMDSRRLAPQMQGRRVEIFQLDYATAEDVETVIGGMLSPLGQAFPITSAETDNRRTREVLVVEDLPPYLDRIREQVAMMDIPPRQVLVEVHMLEVDLSEDNRHGINFDHAFNMKSNLFQLETRGFANSGASEAFMMHLTGGNLTGILETLRTANDAKTLASPKLLCLNGQTARIQVGEQLGFRVTTTTETSTTESVEFLDVGVVLEVTPRVSRDGRVMMRVRPEVSNGDVSATTGLPEEETTELETDVLLADNQGIIIGGLIQETDTDVQSKIPWFGDLKYIGKLFQHNETTKRRSEIIVALLPRVVPYEPAYQQQHEIEMHRAGTPLLHGPLRRWPRPWEPALHDAIKNPINGPPTRIDPNVPPERYLEDSAEYPVWPLEDELPPELPAERVHPNQQKPAPGHTSVLPNNNRFRRLPSTSHSSRKVR